MDTSKKLIKYVAVGLATISTLSSLLGVYALVDFVHSESSLPFGHTNLLAPIATGVVLSAVLIVFALFNMFYLIKEERYTSSIQLSLILIGMFVFVSLGLVQV